MLIFKPALVVAAFCLLLDSAVGGSGVFSQDETAVYFIDLHQHLRVIELASGKISEPSFPNEVRQGQISAIGRSNAGYLLILQPESLIAFDPATKKAVPVFSFAPKPPYGAKNQKWMVDDFAYNPADGSILFSATRNSVQELWLLPKGEQRLKSVWSRRVNDLEGINFNGAGQLFFGYRGDLWRGSIGLEPQGAGGSPPEHVYYLDAIRIVPVATLETSLSTPDQQGVQVVAPGKDRIYLHSRRLGGSGWGNLLSVPTPGAENDAYFELPNRLELYRTELAGVQIYGDNGGESCLCASSSGQKVFFRGTSAGSDEMAFWLIEGNQPPRKLADDLQ